MRKDYLIEVLCSSRKIKLKIENLKNYPKGWFCWTLFLSNIHVERARGIIIIIIALQPDVSFQVALKISRRTYNAQPKLPRPTR